MAKDAYYFSHDSNAKDDPKCVLLIEQLGLEGYGIFWVLIETLRDQPEYKYPLALISALSRRYNTTAEKMKTVVMQYGLFEIENDEFFYSDSLNRRMHRLEHKREMASKAGKISAKNKQLALSSQHTFNKRSTDVQQPFNQQMKTNESKTNENISNTSSAARPKKHKYGEFQNVLLTDADIEKLKSKFTDWQEQIETLSKGIELKGYKYKNHYLAILKWAEKAVPKKPVKENNSSYDIEEYEKMSVEQMMEVPK